MSITEVVAKHCLFVPTTVFAAGNIAIVALDWEQIYPASTNTLTKPINGQVRIKANNNGHTHTDIRFIGKNGEIVWEECCAIDCNKIRTFYCGPDVYAIEARAHFYGISLTDYRITLEAIKL